MNEPENMPTVVEPTSIIERLAMNKDLNIENLKELRAMYNDELALKAKREFSIDFVAMKSELPKVIRWKENSQTKSKYAPLETINATIDPILKNHGFGTSMKVLEQTDAGVKVKVELWHKGGHVEDTTVFMPIDDKGMQGAKNKTMPHAVSSSIMYARRVGECALLNISTGDDKDGNLDNSFITNEQAVEIELLITESKADKDKFFTYMGVKKIPDILARDYNKAKEMLVEKKKRTNKEKTA